MYVGVRRGWYADAVAGWATYVEPPYVPTSIQIVRFAFSMLFDYCVCWCETGASVYVFEYV